MRAIVFEDVDVAKLCGCCQGDQSEDFNLLAINLTTLFINGSTLLINDATKDATNS